MINKRAVNLKLLNEDEFNEFLNSFDTVLTDCDDVLWRDSVPFENAPNVISTLRDLGKRIFYVTNNSMKSRIDLAVNARKMGFIAEKDDFLSASYLAADYLKSINFNKTVYVIANSEKGICEELDLVGIKHSGTGRDAIETNLRDYVAEMQLDEEVGAVVIGYDDHFSYAKMMKAACYLNDPNCLLIGCSPDVRLPLKPRLVIPGIGSIVKAIENVSQRRAVIVGKPNEHVRNVISRNFAVRSDRTLVIGDNANTDILLGTHCGFKTMLILTGSTSLEEVTKWQQSSLKTDQDRIPDVYLDSIGELLPLLK